MINFFYILNLALLFSCLADLRMRKRERSFSMALLRMIFMMPLLAGEYLYFSPLFNIDSVSALIFSENVAALLIIIMAFQLRHATSSEDQQSRDVWPRLALTAAVFAAGLYSFKNPSPIYSVEQAVYIPQNGLLYFSAFFMLLSTLAMAWRLESFWRSLVPMERWQFKMMIAGLFLLCGSLAWCSSYRITYHRLMSEHLRLLALLLLFAWSLVLYAVIRHRLLNRKIFISRKIVYSTVAPLIFAAYLILLGLISLVMRAFGLPLSFVLHWLLSIMGVVFIGLMVMSGKVRHRVRYFVSTNFYVNKYEYRDEWLAFSSLLRGELDEAGVVKALRQILADSLYTRKILIWIGNGNEGYQLFMEPESPAASYAQLDASDPLISFLLEKEHLYTADKETDDAIKKIVQEKQIFFGDSGVVLLVPLTIDEQCIGLIGLGPEFIGGGYGNDDFDLLTALASQAASTLLAVRMAEELAHAREQAAWKILSAFVLHDIKNAATMLALARQNAPQHINNPEFQQDLLESIDDALKRMTKVQARLDFLKGEIVTVPQEIDFCRLLADCRSNLSRQLPELVIDLHCPTAPLSIHTDPEMFARILENLLMNAFEAGGPGTSVRLEATAGEDHGIELIISDSGPGIPPELLPDRLFEPFKTSKPNGSGIGLWQVRGLVGSLGGTIAAENMEEGGARFVIRLPGKFKA